MMCPRTQSLLGLLLVCLWALPGLAQVTATPQEPGQQSPADRAPERNRKAAEETPTATASSDTMKATSASGVQTESSRLQTAARAIEGGQLDRALGELEALADEGFVHPDVSFTRGVAYLRRARSEQAKPGDFGQAAAAFREVLVLTPNDGLARRGLEEARIDSARRSASQSEQVIETIGLARRLLLSLHPWTFFVAAAIAAIAAAVGFFLRRWAGGSWRTGGTISATLGCVALALSLPLAFVSLRLRQSTQLAVVIAQRAPLLDAQGRAHKGVAPLPEGTELRFDAEAGTLVRINAGFGETWLRRSQVRILQEPRRSDKK